MANELKHADIGTSLSKAEWEATTSHVLDSQAQGDVLYFNGTAIVRLGAGTAGNPLITGGAAANPSWFTGLTLTNDGTKTTIIGLAGDYTRIGDAATTSHSLASEDDLLVTGKLEVDGKAWFDTDITCGWIYQGDDIGTRWGGVAYGLYETADPNANAFHITLPAGGGVDVPVLVIQGIAIHGNNLGFFDGTVEPAIAIMNVAGDAYVSLDAGDDSVASAKGLAFYAAADEDIEILNLTNTTGTPRIFWDESDDKFNFSHGLRILTGASGATATASSRLIVENSTDVGIEILGPSVSSMAWRFTTPTAGRNGFFQYLAQAAPELRIGIAGTSALHYTLAAFTFQAATIVDIKGGYHQLTERAAPGAGAANTARIYALEGGGDALTDLCAVFQDGSIDIFAQETTDPNSPIFRYPDNTGLKLVMRRPNGKTHQFIAEFPDGSEFVLKELRHPRAR